MNKTVTINISGIIFHIEEDAYETLSKYISTIRGYFVNAQDKDEIMSDIEARIAELLKEKVSDYKQVVLMADVDHVMNIMGKPEDFRDDDSQSSTSSSEQNYYQGNRRRRVFRDPDGKMIGGVCCGIANYFNIDPVWIRVGLVISVLMSFGILVPFYIILWMIIPEARTTAEKLEMRGEAIDINNISKTIKTEAEQLKQRAEKFGKDFQSEKPVDKLAELLKNIFTVTFKVLGKILGFIFVMIGIFLTVAVVGILLERSAIHGTGAELYVNDLVGTKKLWVVTGIVLILGVPALMLLYKGFKMLFNIKFHNKWLNIGSGILWTFGFIIILFAGISIAKEFDSSVKNRNNFVMSKAKLDTLVVAVDLNNKLLKEFDTYEERSHHGKMIVGGFREDAYQYIEVNGVKQIYGAVRVTVFESETDSFEVNVIKSANGVDKKEAGERTKKLSYNLKQMDSLLLIDPLFKLEPGEKLRNQMVTIEIKVPKGKIIKLDKSLYSFLNDVDNISNTWDGDMVARRWRMTERGLECVDCNGLDLSDIDVFAPNVEPPMPPMPPNPAGININDKDAKVIMNEKGINIKSKDATVDISNNGIKIETKGDKGTK